MPQAGPRPKVPVNGPGYDSHGNRIATKTDRQRYYDKYEQSAVTCWGCWVLKPVTVPFAACFGFCCGGGCLNWAGSKCG